MIKSKNLYLYILAFFLTTQLSRILIPMYGENVRIIIVGIGLLLVIAGVIWSALKKRYYETIVSISLLIPAIIMGIGLFLDNLLLAIIGVTVLFIVAIIFLIIKKKYLKDRF